MSFNVSEVDRQRVRERLTFFLIIVGGAFGLLVLRFWFLQVVEHQTWSRFGEKKQLRPVRIVPKRGRIMDRDGRILADWEQSFNVTLTGADLEDETFPFLARILNTPEEELRQRYKDNRAWSPFIPTLVAEHIDPLRVMPRVEANRVDLPGVDIEVRPVRKYAADSWLVCHMLGYLGEIDQKELRLPENDGFRMGDKVGKAGLENSLEPRLRGRFGERYKLVDAVGRELTREQEPERWREKEEFQELFEAVEKMYRPPVSGQSAVLTIDLGLQSRAAGHMGENIGSVVVMDTRTGELLVLLSTPGYDPSMFVGGISSADWNILNLDPRKPLFNRVLMGSYPPASIFKIVLAAAALEDRHITTSTTYNCPGSYKVIDTTFRCWNRHGHGDMNLHDSLVESCDVFFYKLGHDELTIDSISLWARKFGLGAPALEEGLLPQRSGLIPDREWKRKTRNMPWFRGETVLVSIGQGYTQVTPLQAALIPAAIANNGTLMRPRLIHHFEDVHGKELTEFKPRVMKHEFISQRNVDIIKRAMEEVVESEKGTAHKYARSDIVRIAGKTGTAEVSKKYQGRPIEEVPFKYRDHAWFVAYAPAENPAIAVVVMIEHGGSGGSAAGPIAKKIIEDYFTGDQARRTGTGQGG